MTNQTANCNDQCGAGRWALPFRFRFIGHWCLVIGHSPPGDCLIRKNLLLFIVVKLLRQIILWAVLTAIGLLVVLSAIGALCGAEKAKELFNSWPLIAFWFVCLLLLASGFAAFRRLITAPAGIVMHLGAILIIAGAMWGSQGAHELRKWALGATKVQSGIMLIPQQEAEKTIYSNHTHEPIAGLPFSLYLKDFSIDYYPPKEKEWFLIVVAPAMDAQGQMGRREERIAWKEGEETQVPMTGVHLKVLRYFARARPTFTEGAKPHLAITDADGKMLGDLPPEAGAEVTFKEPPVTVKVTRVFQNLKVVGAGAEHQVVDDVGHGENPALQVLVGRQAEVVWEGYVFPQMPRQVRPEPEAPPLTLQYAVPGPTGAAEDPSSPSPAIELQLTHEGRTEHHWLLPEPGASAAQLSLATLVAGPSDAHGMGRMMTPMLYLVEPQGHVKSYKSDVAVLEDNRKVDEAVIEVNHPLHLGGYHFYQSDYDHQNEAYTVLSVSSDSGLAAVYLGLAILSIGAFWRFWGEAAWAWMTRSDQRESRRA